MRLLNLGCGSNRPGDPWVNLDTLRAFLSPGTPERRNLDAESNYVDHWLGHTPMPFQSETFDGVLASHCIEHWDAQEAIRILRDCRRILKPGGILVASVPDATFFRMNANKDTPENAESVFGEKITPGEGPTFLQYALLFRQHVQVLTGDALWCILRGAGFERVVGLMFIADGVYAGDSFSNFTPEQNSIFKIIEPVMNRRKFSAEMIALKP